MIKTTIRATLLASTALALSACQYEELNRSEFMSDAAGDAVAHNSALQIIDPWPLNSGNNNLRVPAVKYGGEPTSEDSSPSPLVIQAAGNNK